MSKKDSGVFLTKSNGGTCQYGCGGVEHFTFGNGKQCCSKHYNHCPGKKAAFSSRDHSVRTTKSLETRIRTGVTKSSQIKAGKTRVDSGHYERLAKTMRGHWATHPWDNSAQCPLLAFHGSELKYQGSYEYHFLNMLVDQYSLNWVVDNVKRGPSFKYIDPDDQVEKLYISDFIIGDTVYEIKSDWTWDEHGNNAILRNRNRAKLKAVILSGLKVKLIKEKVEYNGFVD